MSLDFPSSPTDGQTFGSYVWSASKGVWQAREESAAVAVTSPTKPVYANSGDLWYNTSTGITYVYYNDGSSGQWVEMVTSGLPAIETVMPTGSVIQTARPSAPLGWMICDGSPLLVANYQVLFNAIGYTYGGSGTTFYLPNLKGRVPIGMDSSQPEFDSLGETGGAKSTPLTSAHIPQHSHAIDHDHPSFTSGGGSSHRHWISSADRDDANMTTTGQNVQNYGLFADAGSYSADDPNRGTGRYTAYESGHTHNIDVPAFSGTSGNYGSASVTPVSALQPYIVMNYIIKV